MLVRASTSSVGQKGHTSVPVMDGSLLSGQLANQRFLKMVGWLPQVPRDLLASPQATADTVPHHPKPLILRGWPGPSLLTAQRSSVSFSSMQMWLLPGNPIRAPQAPMPPCLAPRPNLWTAVLFLGQLSELSLD